MEVRVVFGGHGGKGYWPPLPPPAQLDNESSYANEVLTSLPLFLGRHFSWGRFGESLRGACIVCRGDAGSAPSPPVAAAASAGGLPPPPAGIHRLNSTPRPPPSCAPSLPQAALRGILASPQTRLPLGPRC